MEPWEDALTFKPTPVIERPIFRRAEGMVDRGLVLTIVGPRRAGKSSLLKWLVARLGGVYVNFEDERIPREPEVIRRIHEKYREGILALDEVHLVEGWEGVVNALREERPIVVSGSTAHLLSREYGTFLTGRRRELEVFPLTYKEFLTFGGSSYEEFLSIGGFPEVVLRKDLSLLSTYLQDVIARDIGIRYSIRHLSQLKEMAKHLLAHTSKQFSFRSIARTFGLSTTTAEEYLSYLEEAFLLERLPAFHPKLSARKRMPFKVHAVDHGYAAFFALPHWKARALETAVYRELRSLLPKDFLYYSPSPEWDVVVAHTKPLLKLQVSYSVEGSEERECRGGVVGLPWECPNAPTYRPWELRQALEEHLPREVVERLPFG